MGFSSWDCPCCGHSIRHEGATNKTSAWLAKATVVTPEGDRFSGTYDGYGGLGSHDLGDMSEDFAMYHTACWKIAGKPEFSAASEPARDQGHFVGEYDPAEPKTAADCAALKKSAEEKAAEDARKAREFRLQRIAELEAEGKPVPEWMRG